MGKPIKVSQLNSYLRRVLDTDPILGNIAIIGEISNLTYHRTGHVYFTLKDSSCRINCFLPKNYVSSLRYELEEDMEIIAYGRVSVFERDGRCTLTVKDVDVNGDGALKVAFEKMKKKLQEEGLFDSQYKKPLPSFPERVAIVTSDIGAAVQDIIKIITSKNKIIDILIYPVLVQGPQAAPEIATALDDLNENYADNVDVIIVGRGGGSTEELWAFNEEIVARSIFKSEIPVISAVGHEVDFTISDYVADYRAETPTKAAEIVAPDIEMLKEKLEILKHYICDSMDKIVEYNGLRISAADLSVMKDNLLYKIEMETAGADRIIAEARQNVQGRLEIMNRDIESLKSDLESNNPYTLMKKGYALVTDPDGAVISSVRDLKENQEIRTIMHDGAILSTVTAIEEETDD